MKKILFSLLFGTIIGGIFSYFFLKYEDWSYIIRDIDGELKITDIDIHYVFNAGLFICATSIIIFIIWTLVEKRMKSNKTF